MLRGAVLGLQDGGDGNDTAEAGSESMEEAVGEKQPTEDQTDNGQEFQSPWKQVQRQHLHLMVELLRPQDDIRLVRGPAELLSVEEQYCEIRAHPGNWGGGLPKPQELCHFSQRHLNRVRAYLSPEDWKTRELCPA